MGLRFLTIFSLVSLPCAYAATQARGGEILDYTLRVSIDIPASRITGVAKIPVKSGQEIKLNRGTLHLIEILLEGQKIAFPRQEEIVRIFPSRPGVMEIRYAGTFNFPKPPEGAIAQGAMNVPSDVVDGRGIFLTGIWYPQPDQMCHYHLTATLPDGYEAISEAETIRKTTNDGQTIFSFAFPHPLDSIHLIATNRYAIVQDHFNGIEIFAYFFHEDAGLAQTYIQNTKRYLRLYENLIGRYPYKRFSIVENFLPTGYSMPTYTLLGKEVVRLPFIVETSLGHEILHQWFGNLVYVNTRKGNWSEGLTTYLADHLYEEQKGLGFKYRKDLLIDYQSYVNDKNEFPLQDFQARTDFSSKAIGYGKAAMVFHMLKTLIGERAFYDSLKYFTAEMRFKKASWEDLQRAFEKNSAKDLSWFFNQWTDRKGLLELEVEDVKIKPRADKFEVHFVITQKKGIYEADLPVVFYSAAGKIRNLFHLTQEKNSLTALLDDIPSRIVVDEDYDIARRLTPGEFPPVIARLIGAEEKMIALPPSGAGMYETVIDTLRKSGAAVRESKDITDADLRSASLIILGAQNPLAEKLYGAIKDEGGFTITIKEDPWNSSKVVGIIQAQSQEETDAAFAKIFHYGRYTHLSFDHGRNVHRQVAESGRGMTKDLAKEPIAVDPAKVKSLPEVIDHVASKKIIYVGETHNRFSHHVVQLEIIKNLHRKGKKVAIGMEMFQRPVQKVLDDYVAGKVDERDFLKKSEYFRRWGFDFNLYRPILQFARSEHIPVVALNIPKEIVDKVARSGLESLTGEEKKDVPGGMDFADAAYKERLEKVFQEHESLRDRPFDFFYQAQILWDEAMSESIDAFLRKQPGYQMVVLAGNGHLAHGSGIPQRTMRRNGYDYAVVLNDVELEKNVATYVVYPGVVEVEGPPKLMVSLREEEGKVTIERFSEGSVSQKAGLQVGDTILALDQTPIQSVDDVRIDLLSRKKGEKVRVKILRKNSITGDKEMEFEVALQ